VLTMSFSEFGRRVQSNASNGTDHGTAAPMMIVGTKVNPIIIGNNPNLSDLDTGGNLKMQTDFRQVYTSVLSQWFGVAGSELKSSMLKDFTQVPIIKTSASSVADDFGLVANLQCTPNPLNGTPGHIRYNLPTAADVQLRIVDLDGRQVMQLTNEYQSSGDQSIDFNASNLPSGSYFCELRAGQRRSVCQVVVAH